MLVKSEIEKKINDTAGFSKRIKEYAERLNKLYKIPNGLSSDYLTKRLDIETASPEIKTAIGKVMGVDVDDSVIAGWKYETPKLPKQLTYEMIQIADDQWIGKISVKELMQLRDAQIIKYNENTQRVMKRIHKGYEEIYQISLNKKAILSMEELFRDGIYIPNTITLNIPEGTDFIYRNGTLIIKKLDHFDITDGYHRYIAMSNLYNEDNDFDYPMELRITNYSEDKSRQLIWQEDQKTKMSRIDSDSMNMNSAANKVVQRLNVSSLFNLAGQLNTNKGIINSAELAEIIKVTYFPVSKIFSKKKELEAIIKAEQEIREGINYVTSKDMELLEKPWHRVFLYCLVYNINNNVDQDSLLSMTNYMADKAYEEKMFRGREVTRIDMKRLAGLKEAAKKYV